MKNTPPRSRKKVRITALSFAKMIAAMTGAPISVRELYEEIGMSPKTVRGYVLALYNEGVCRIGGWEKYSRGCVPCYIMGEGKDAPRPEPKSRKQRSADYRSRRRTAGILGLNGHQVSA